MALATFCLCLSSLGMRTTLSCLRPGPLLGEFVFVSLTALGLVSCTKSKLVTYPLTCPGVSQHVKLAARNPDPCPCVSFHQTMLALRCLLSGAQPGSTPRPVSRRAPRTGHPFLDGPLSRPAHKEQLPGLGLGSAVMSGVTFGG